MARAPLEKFEMWVAPAVGVRPGAWQPSPRSRTQPPYMTGWPSLPRGTAPFCWNMSGIGSKPMAPGQLLARSVWVTGM